ncbi:MAG: MMPL family transporter [Actinomycetota bacterium]
MAPTVPGLRPALLPIIAAFATMAGSLLVLLGMTQVTDVGGYAVDVVILFGLALAVDYSLLMVNRYREEWPRERTGLARWNAR